MLFQISYILDINALRALLQLNVCLDQNSKSFICVNNIIAVKMRVYAQEYNFMTTAIIILSAISVCFAMKQEGACVRRNLVKDALRMKHVEEKECVFLRQHCQHMVHASKSFPNQITVWCYPCTKQIWLKSILIYSSIKVILKRSADQGS